MARFSDRIGVTQPPSLSREGMSIEFRTALWNVVHVFLFEGVIAALTDRWAGILRGFYMFQRQPLDDFIYNIPDERRRLREWWFHRDRQWWEIYNTIDYLVPRFAEYHQSDAYVAFNSTLERESSRFRFVDALLTEITDKNEIAAIDKALSVAERFAGAREHVAAALRFLSQRPEPDYRNSIRESISAVESTLKVLTGMDHAPLGDALRAFSKTNPIHGALFSGLSSLYGYTSNEHGIRHALLEADADVGFAEAKFMVVACAAFMNFLIAKGAV